LNQQPVDFGILVSTGTCDLPPNFHPGFRRRRSGRLAGRRTPPAPEPLAAAGRGDTPAKAVFARMSFDVEWDNVFLVYDTDADPR
jgi:hypothetical protein